MVVGGHASVGVGAKHLRPFLLRHSSDNSKIGLRHSRWESLRSRPLASMPDELFLNCCPVNLCGIMPVCLGKRKRGDSLIEADPLRITGSVILSPR